MKGTSDEHDELTELIIGCAMKIRNALGSGLLESAYHTFFLHELRKARLQVLSQSTFPVSYDGVRVEVGYRPDMVVDGKVIVELKCVTSILPVHQAQLLTYLRLSRIRTGLLMNFHEVPFKNGIRRLSV